MRNKHAKYGIKSNSKQGEKQGQLITRLYKNFKNSYNYLINNKI